MRCPAEAAFAIPEAAEVGRGPGSPGFSRVSSAGGLSASSSQPQLGSSSQLGTLGTGTPSKAAPANVPLAKTTSLHKVCQDNQAHGVQQRFCNMVTLSAFTLAVS